MTRTLNTEEHASKRNDILDAAQRLIYTKGYEGMSIQDLLDELGISKGAFYHYFASKSDLLEALSVRLIDEGLKIIIPAVDNDSLSAIQKIHSLFDTSATWKTARKEYLMALLRVWYADDNTVFRKKLFNRSIELITPLFEQVIQQGIREGVFNTPYPEQVGQVVLSLLVNYSETIAQIMLSDVPGAEQIRQIEMFTSVFSNAMERVLGAPPDSLRIFDTSILPEWIPLEEDGKPEAVSVEGTSPPQTGGK
jgi:AcrR family transcriptional regulator